MSNLQLLKLGDTATEAFLQNTGGVVKVDGTPVSNLLRVGS